MARGEFATWQPPRMAAGITDLQQRVTAQSLSRISLAHKRALDAGGMTVTDNVSDYPYCGDGQRPTRGYPQARSRLLSGCVGPPGMVSAKFGTGSWNFGTGS
jgi:hypothetical protein